MENVEEVVHERNDAFLRLETGDGADPPERTVTSFAGFTYKYVPSIRFLSLFDYIFLENKLPSTFYLLKLLVIKNTKFHT